jgi:hypothetical protein
LEGLGEGFAEACGVVGVKRVASVADFGIFYDYPKFGDYVESDIGFGEGIVVERLHLTLRRKLFRGRLDDAVIGMRIFPRGRSSGLLELLHHLSLLRIVLASTENGVVHVFSYVL